MKFVIWGCGNRGKMLYKCMKKMHVIAFIDSDKALIGKAYKDIPIISFEEYMKSEGEIEKTPVTMEPKEKRR